ncbi:MAG: HAMP domain-containing histidine kinase [Oscillospiraceae bacterium]|nr:HAMP domain-containing histidine kinase [Oscillospiraceae bacterium]
MAKRIVNILLTALMLFFMLTTYLSGALLLAVGVGYGTALKNNPDSVANYTRTSSFRRTTGEYMDALYRAVSGDEPLTLPYDDDVAFFAYGLDTNRVYCSDGAVFDIPSFDEKYMNSPSYIYYLKYSSASFRGNDKASGVTETFDYSYTDAAAAVFGNDVRYYADAAIILAAEPPAYGLRGYAYSRTEFFLLKNGAQVLFVAAGLFLTSLAVLLTARTRRRMIERSLAAGWSWIFAEIKLAAVAVLVWKLAGFLIRGETSAFWALTAAAVLPLAYLIYCGIRYENGGFFRVSLIGRAYALVRDLYDTVAPVSTPLRRFRRRAAALMVFGIALPALFFVLADVLVGLEAVRISAAVVLVVDSVVAVLLFRRYGKLVNDVGALTRLTSVFEQGGRLPETDVPKNDDIRRLADNLRRYDESVDAAAERKIQEASLRMQQVYESVDEIKAQLGTLCEMLGDGASPEAAGQARSILEMADDMQRELLSESMLNAPVLKRMDLLAAMDEVLNAKIAEFSAARLRVRSRLPDPPAYITADYAHIRAALDILFTNTSLYAQAGTEVEITLEKDGQNWVYTVENEESPYAYAGAAGAALAARLNMAREYVSLNGGTLAQESDNGRNTVIMRLPAAR